MVFRDEIEKRLFNINICAKTITSTFDDLIRKIVKHYINKFRNRNSRAILINLYIFSLKKSNY